MYLRPSTKEIPAKYCIFFSRSTSNNKPKTNHDLRSKTNALQFEQRVKEHGQSK